jgi:glycerophosphoryl diester phosphodiesterase
MKIPIIVAHRGLHQQHVENTLKALNAAWTSGINWCEIDVRGSAEHEPFLMHDEMLDRTTSGVGPIADTRATVLKKLGVPSLEEAIKSMRGDAKLLVEIKPKVDLKVVDRTLALCDPARCIVQSFDVELLQYAASKRQDLKLHLLVDDAKKLEGGPWDAISAQFKTLDAASVKKIRDLGFRVGAWTPNAPADIEAVARLGVDIIVSDEPLIARDIVKKIG